MQCPLDGHSDTRSHPLLEGIHVVRVAFPTVGPEVASGREIAQHHQHPQAPVAIVADPAVQLIARLASRADREPAAAQERSGNFIGDRDRPLGRLPNEREGLDVDQRSLEKG